MPAGRSALACRRITRDRWLMRIACPISGRWDGVPLMSSRTCDHWEDTVGIGGSIFLIAVGAILAFAVHVSVGWLSLNVVGFVLMIAGRVGLLLTLWFWSNRRRTVATPAVPVERERVVDERRRVEYPDSQYSARPVGASFGPPL